MRRPKKIVVLGCGAVAWWLVSCREVPAPEGGILSLSPVQLPSPGLVAGDTMRDSTGIAAPLRVVAYGVNGDTVRNATLSFVVIDTAPGAHLDGAFLIGDKAGTTVRVIGSSEVIQTQPASVKVTLSPDTLIAADSVVHRRTYSFIAGDTIVDFRLATTVVHRATPASGVEAVIVRYAIEQAPPGLKGARTLLLLNGTVEANRDTSKTGGGSSRVARLRAAAKTTFATDTALISATASYAGRIIGRVLFTLIYNGGQ